MDAVGFVCLAVRAMGHVMRRQGFARLACRIARVANVVRMAAVGVVGLIAVAASIATR